MGRKRAKLAAATGAVVVKEEAYIKTDSSAERASKLDTLGLNDISERCLREAGHEGSITGLRRKNIKLQVPLFYSNRMQVSTTRPKTYYIPLVEHVDPSPTIAANPSPDYDVAGKEFSTIRTSSHLVPLPPAPKVVTGENEVPLVSSWLCCVSTL